MGYISLSPLGNDPTPIVIKSIPSFSHFCIKDNTSSISYLSDTNPSVIKNIFLSSLLSNNNWYAVYIQLPGQQERLTSSFIMLIISFIFEIFWKIGHFELKSTILIPSIVLIITSMNISSFSSTVYGAINKSIIVAIEWE